MTFKFNFSKSIFALAFCVATSSGVALAASAGNAAEKDKDKHEHNSSLNKTSPSHFDDERRELIGSYYKAKQGSKACPPGLAKKANGCLPPGQAKKWQLGHALQANTPYQSVPLEVLRLLGEPPAGEHYGMIDEDILLLADVTELVLEVILGPSQ
tara:strand:+ start:35 stop:499 length:465 start_codon:yes stop_codon:yes gene_type:complete